MPLTFILIIIHVCAEIYMIESFCIIAITIKRFVVLVNRDDFI